MSGFRYIEDAVTLEFEPEKCVGCGACSAVCPHAVFVQQNGKAEMADRGACMECGACMINCPTQAITVEVGVGCASAVLRTSLGFSGCDCECSLDDYRKPAGGKGASCC